MSEFEVTGVDDAILAFGAEKREEIVAKLTEFFAGMDIRHTDVEGAQLMAIDFHFEIDGEQIEVQRTVKGWRKSG